MFKTIEMKQTFKIPKGCTEVSIEQTDNGLVIEYVPKGWWEYRHFNPDEVYNNKVDEDVVAWMPLPEPYHE